jgi:DNA polymerase III subunit alpha
MDRGRTPEPLPAPRTPEEEAVQWVSTHHHTTYSYQDGIGRPIEHFERAADLGIRAIAVTDHGNVSGHVEAEKASRRTGVQFIPGLEAYTATEPQSPRKFHLTVLAMNAEGYRNLNRLVSASWESFYRWPTVDGQMLADFSDGLIVLSGCSDSLLACSLLGGKSIEPADASFERAVNTAAKFRELLGDRFYLEVQQFPELKPRAHDINRAFEKIGARLKIPLVGTADVHTVRPGMHEVRALLHASGRGSNTIAQQLSEWEYDVPDYIPTSDEEVRERLLGTGLSKRAAEQAIDSTGEIADRCKVELPKADRFRFAGTRSDLKW